MIHTIAINTTRPRVEGLELLFNVLETVNHFLVSSVSETDSL